MIRSARSDDPADKRQFPRRPLPIGYSEVRVRRNGKQRFSMVGHAYDISAGGVRFELDRPLEDGEEVDVRVQLPGTDQHEIRAHGAVVRFHDPGEVGPVRMAVSFSELANPVDRLFIDSYCREA